MLLTDALMIQVGLDPTSFNKGAKEVNSTFETVTKNISKNANEAEKAAKKAAKETEAANKKLAESYNKAGTAFLEMTAIFLGGRGFQQFISEANTANNTLGRFSAGLGASPELVSAWSTAARRMGGSASAAQASLQSLSDSLVDLRTQGKAPPNELFLLEAQSGKNIDFSHGLERYTSDLAKAASQLAKTDPAAANRYLRALGIDPATAALLIRQGANMKSYIEQQKKLAPSKDDIDAANKMTDAQGRLGASYDYLASKVMSALSPALTWLINKFADLIKWMGDFASAHPKLVIAITAVVGALAVIATAGVIATTIALTGALAGLAGISLGPLVAGLAALGLIGAGGVAAAYVAGAFDDAKAADGKGGKKLSGNDAIRRRGSHGGDGGQAGDMPAGSNAGNLSKLIDEEAKRAGIDPRILEGVRAGESGHGKHYDIGDVNDGGAYGPFQFNMGKGRFGDQFKRDTGLDPRDPRTIPAQTRYMAEFLARQLKRDPNYASGGRGSRLHAVWHGYAGPRNPDPRWGDAGYVPSPAKSDAKAPAPTQQTIPLWKGMPPPAVASVSAMHRAALNNISNDQRVSTTSTSNEAHINGPINIHTAAIDAPGIANDLDRALKNTLFAQNANYGPA